MNAYRSSPSGGGAGTDEAKFTIMTKSNGVTKLWPSSCYRKLVGFSLNTPIQIGREVANIQQLLAESHVYNCETIIPDKVNDCAGLFLNADGFGTNIRFAGKEYRAMNVDGLVYKASGVYDKRINLFFNQALNNVFNNMRLKVYGYPADNPVLVFDTLDVNCYYNSQCNLYFYHNYAG